MILGDDNDIDDVNDFGDDNDYDNYQGEEDNIGKKATVHQGYGKTENDTSGALLEANTTIISNDHCTETLNYNVTGKDVVRWQIDQGLPNGLNNQLLCTLGTHHTGTKVDDDDDDDDDNNCE